ncbi:MULTISPECIES: low specificity L-threonine aldolase [unclassified Streptomyces]|uniref:threonine aldolase family protein n=1 Tax=unclassified Streptomyces TaxID=2593676 RepID=UPI001F3724F1|nr:MULTISPECIES: beta-eliminating lyase-related protein [unclassified Streptomyces]
MTGAMAEGSKPEDDVRPGGGRHEERGRGPVEHGGAEQEGGGESQGDDPRRRLAAWRGAGRALSRKPGERTLRERLTELVHDGEEVYDLGGSVDLYGDGIVAELERRVAELLGFPAAVFFPTGTMAQQVALRCWAGRSGNPVVALHPMAHPEVHERDALSVVSGLRTVHPTREPRVPTAKEVRGLDEPFGTLMVELPLRDAGFVLPDWDELVEVVEAARERDALVHFDGARLWETTTHFGRGLSEIAGLADSVYVSFYKSLGGLSGAALVGPESFVDEARAWRHRYGGSVFQQHPAALAALVGLARELPRLPEYVARAAVVAEALREGLEAGGAPWLRLQPERPHTHEFCVWLPYPPDVLSEAALRQSEQTGVTLFHRWFGGGPAGPPGVAFTEVSVTAPGLEWTTDDVKGAAERFMGFVREVTQRGVAQEV